MTDTIRVYDLAKELNLPNKDVIEMLDKKLGVKVKSHSSAVSELQAKKLRELVKEPKVEQAKKPKAFIVKKAKPKAEEAPKEEEKKTEPEVKPVEKVKLGKVEPTLPAPAPRLKLGKIEPVLPQRPPKQERPARPQSKDAVKKDVKTDRKPELKKEGAPSQRPRKSQFNVILFLRKFMILKTLPRKKAVKNKKNLTVQKKKNKKESAWKKLMLKSTKKDHMLKKLLKK
ncbi:MAG: translation initiation factor IF-2 N-terminal domain-containing protein [Candidatus Gastranaerophilaceae bacterium]